MSLHLHVSGLLGVLVEINEGSVLLEWLTPTAYGRGPVQLDRMPPSGVREGFANVRAMADLEQPARQGAWKSTPWGGLTKDGAQETSRLAMARAREWPEPGGGVHGFERLPTERMMPSWPAGLAAFDGCAQWLGSLALDLLSTKVMAAADALRSGEAAMWARGADKDLARYARDKDHHLRGLRVATVGRWLRGGVTSPHEALGLLAGNYLGAALNLDVDVLQRVPGRVEPAGEVFVQLALLAAAMARACVLERDVRGEHEHLTHQLREALRAGAARA